MHTVLSWAGTAEAATEHGTEVLRDAAVILQAAFPRVLRKLPLEQLVTLVRSPAEGVSELGARILLGHEVGPSDLPDELLVALLTSPFEGVRGVGLRLYGELDGELLVQRFAVLCDLLTSALADVRHGARSLVARVLRTDAGVGDRLVAALLPALVIDGPEGMHESLVEVFRTELSGACARLGRDEVLRLIAATQSVVQSFGGELLANVDPSTLSLPQLVTMSSSDIHTVRQAAFSLLPARTHDARAEPEALLGMFDAEWDDTRAFAMGYLDDHVGLEAIDAELTIAICDSVRPDVQAFGRRTITRRFDSEDGPAYLLKLSQHPSPEMQQFVSAWLQTHAAGHEERVEALVPFFVAVVTRPNVGAVTKARVLSFLEREASASEAGARVAARVAEPLSASGAVTHRAWGIRVLAAIRRRWPDIDVPVVVRPFEVRDGV